LIHKLPANRIMRSEVTTVQASDSLLKAGRLMLEKKIGCVCVVDEGGKLEGIVTDTDFVRLTCEALAKS
jgi:CBS domain-containing protein